MDLRIARALCGFAHELDDPERAVRLMCFAVCECIEAGHTREFIDCCLKYGNYLCEGKGNETIRQVHRILGTSVRHK